VSERTISVTGTLAASHDLFIFDLDGVVYIGPEPVPGAVAAITRLHEEGRPVAYATNNAARRAPTVAAHLMDLGVPADTAEVVTSAQVSAAVLADRLPAGSAVLVVGTGELAAEVADVGLRPVWSADDKPVAVVQGTAAPSAGNSWPRAALPCGQVHGGWPPTPTAHCRRRAGRCPATARWLPPWRPLSTAGRTSSWASPPRRCSSRR
jgi:glycerol-1-phosphatase